MTGPIHPVVTEQRADTWLVIQYRLVPSQPWQDMTKREVPDDDREAAKAGGEMSLAMETLRDSGPTSTEWRLIDRTTIAVTTEEVLDQ